MAVCDFNCFECIYSDCIYDSFNDESGLFYDVSVSREIDSYLLFPDHKRKKYYQEQEHKEYINARQREYYRNCFVYGLGRKLRVLNKNSSTDVDSSQICPHVSNIKNKKSYKERMEEINARQKKYYQDHKEEISARNRKYYQEHREEICAHQREYYRDCFVYGLGRELRSSKKSSQNSEL